MEEYVCRGCPSRGFWKGLHWLCVHQLAVGRLLLPRLLLLPQLQEGNVCSTLRPSRHCRIRNFVISGAFPFSAHALHPFLFFRKTCWHLHNLICRKIKTRWPCNTWALGTDYVWLCRELFGEDNVGLVTGDAAVNREAPILIMTTEILRNMLYQRCIERKL